MLTGIVTVQHCARPCVTRPSYGNYAFLLFPAVTSWHKGILTWRVARLINCVIHLRFLCRHFQWFLKLLLSVVVCATYKAKSWVASSQSMLSRVPQLLRLLPVSVQRPRADLNREAGGCVWGELLLRGAAR